MFDGQILIEEEAFKYTMSDTQCLIRKLFNVSLYFVLIHINCASLEHAGSLNVISFTLCCFKTGVVI